MAMLVDGVGIAKVGMTEVENVLVATDVGTNDGTKLGLTLRREVGVKLTPDSINCLISKIWFKLIQTRFSDF